MLWGRPLQERAASAGSPLIALIAGLAVVVSLAFASAASAAPTLSAKTEAVSNVSYTSAHVTGHVSTPGINNAFFQNEVTFQYSTDKVNWTTGANRILPLVRGRKIRGS